MIEQAGIGSKFGHLVSGDDVDFTYPNVWAQEVTTGPDRLVIAPSGQYIDLLIEMLSVMEGPFGFLYVLVVPRGEKGAGRYQSPEPLSLNEVRTFLERYRDFFEGDGRHMLWVASTCSSSMLIYDRHDVIYAYGELENFKPILSRRFISEVSSIKLPVPHCHRYHARYDSEEAEILSSRNWRFSSLRDSDED
jgi:hypothetical protein